MSNGYFGHLKLNLTEYNVTHAPGNNGNTNWGSRCVQGWLGDDPSVWDVITVNFGLHDLAFPDNEHIGVPTYSRLLRSVFDQLKAKTSAKLMWVTTTPVPTNPPEECVLIPGRLENDVVSYNAAAGAIVDDLGLLECDLHSVINDYCGEGYSSCNITQCKGPHFSPEGFSMLGQSLAQCVRSI